MPETTFTYIKKRQLSCDQISELMSILERLQRTPNAFSSFTRIPEIAQLAALLEIMGTLGYEFEDENAAGNALSRFDEFNKLRGLD